MKSATRRSRISSIYDGFILPQADFIAPQFIQEITKNALQEQSIFCIRPKVVIISWRTEERDVHP